MLMIIYDDKAISFFGNGCHYLHHINVYELYQMQQYAMCEDIQV